MNVKKNFASRLKELREAKKMNQAQLAKKLGISRASISLYENCERVPDIEFLDKAAKEFDVSYEYLFGVSNKKEVDFDSQAIQNKIGLSEKTLNCLQTINIVKNRSEYIDELQKTLFFLLNELQFKEITIDQLKSQFDMGICDPTDYPEDALEHGVYEWNCSSVLRYIADYLNSTPHFFATEWAKQQRENNMSENIDFDELIDTYRINRIIDALKEAKKQYNK